MNALANKEIGTYFKTHFVSSYQKVGNFSIAGDQKQGGNVASYFATADGRVLHIVPGPVDAKVLLRETRWAVETWKLAQLSAGESTEKLEAFFRNAHAHRVRLEHGLDLRKATKAQVHLGAPNGSTPVPPIYEQPRFKALGQQGRAHLILCAAPLAQVGQVYRVVFEKVLNEAVSVRPVQVAD